VIPYYLSLSDIVAVARLPSRPTYYTSMAIGSVGKSLVYTSVVFKRLCVLNHEMMGINQLVYGWL